ncbi:hypothetical protein CLDAP_30250 [Caldilinea aerophila DSM 14535 = NBRC 104270]|uniref:Carbohydrate ABC transporter substrate-binding protein n=2 Tax=Caldilineaceae TaxID=475964 RepID=I0I727_CALAS|nr:hypothetical protein CLDAP_30250 [Caldilinea aerophila DSM 14535 = NBRC 104270]
MRIYTTLVLSLILALLISACTLPAAAPTEGGVTSGAPTIELLYMTHNHAPSIPVNEAIIAEFEASHPNVKITFSGHFTSIRSSKLSTSASSPGGFWMPPDF